MMIGFQIPELRNAKYLLKIISKCRQKYIKYFGNTLELVKVKDTKLYSVRKCYWRYPSVLLLTINRFSPTSKDFSHYIFMQYLVKVYSNTFVFSLFSFAILLNVSTCLFNVSASGKMPHPTARFSCIHYR